MRISDWSSDVCSSDLGRSQRNHLGWLESRASQKVSRGEKAGKWCGSTRAMMVAPMLVDICGLLRSIILLLDMVGCSMHGIVFMGFRRSRKNTGQENHNSDEKGKS